jgi:hypothetical protein
MNVIPVNSARKLLPRIYGKICNSLVSIEERRTCINLQQLERMHTGIHEKHKPFIMHTKELKSDAGSARTHKHTNNSF